MASAWGSSWGSSWGNAWGAISSAPTIIYITLTEFRSSIQESDVKSITLAYANSSTMYSLEKQVVTIAEFSPVSIS